MMKSNFSNRRTEHKTGFSVLEAIISIAVFGVLAAGTLSLVWAPIAAASDARDRSRAVFLAEEGIEAARAIRNEGWLGLTEGDHGLAQVGGRWSFSGTGDTIDHFSRVTTVSPVNRGEGGDIVEIGGAPDPRTKQIAVTVSWDSAFGVSRSVQSAAILTNWNAYDWTQTTDTDFYPGIKTNVQVTGTGADASIELAPSVKTWVPGEGNLIVHKDSALWHSGTFTDTQVVGVDPDSKVEIKGVPGWIQIYSGSSFFQTTDADFATGTFNNTAVVDTGDLGAVTLAGGLHSWAEQISPVASQLYDVAMTSSSDGWAVGQGGTIVRWNGTDWTEYATSPTSSALTGISLVSPTVGYAVGSGSAFIKWNGGSWVSQTNVPNKRVMVSLDALSESQVWAAGNSGYIYFWNGTAWSGYAKIGNNTWNAVDMLSPTDGWAVAANGGIAGCHPSTGDCSTMSNWTLYAGYSSPRALTDVSCASASLCFAVGFSGQISKWDGAAWTNFTSPTGNNLNSVSMISPTDGWAVGAGGTVIRWNGTAWSSVSSPSATAMSSVFALSSSEAYAVGLGGVIWQYGGHYNSPGTYLSKIFDAGSSVPWGHIFWNESLPDFTDLTLSSRTGNTPVPDATWSAWSGEMSDPTNASISSPAGRYFQYRATFSTTYMFHTPRLNSVSIYYNEPAGGTYFDVRVVSPTDGWAVGQGGQIARFDGLNWSVYTPSPTTDSLLDVDFADAGNVWAVGATGRIVYWNGSAWSAQTSPVNRQLNGIDVLSAVSAFAVGAHGTFIRYSSGIWTSLASPTVQDLNAVSMISDSDGFTVGDNGKIFRWNGSAWSAVGSGTTTALNGVHMNSSADGWAVGQGGLTLRWNGTVWTSVASPTSNELRDVWCLASDDCWAVGVKATLLHWNGSAWSQTSLVSPLTPVIQGIHLTTATEGWAVGEGGAIYHYTSTYPSTANWLSPVVDSGLAGMRWNTVSWDSLEPIGTGVQIITRTGPTPAVDGSWSPWSSPLTDRGGSLIASPDNQYFQYMVLFSTTIAYNTPSLTQVRIVNAAATGQPLYDVDGSAVGDVWAVGRSGTIIHYDGSAWQPAASPTIRNLNGLDVINSAEAYAVGDSGTFLRLASGVWNTSASPTTQDMMAVSMLSSTYGAAVGAAGTVCVWDGVSWSLLTALTSNTLRGVHLYSPTLGAAVGDGGVIFMWNGTVWSSVASPVVTRLNAVHFIASNLGWAVGDGGKILKWNGTSWSSVASPTVARITAVESRSLAEAWAVGDFGMILKYDGVTWESFTSPTTRSLAGITVQAPTDGWICGAYGSLLRDPGPYAPFGTFVSTVLDTGLPASVFDVIFWNATLPAGTVTVATRSGNTPEPDETWSVWSSEFSAADGSPASSPPARYFQYRASLSTPDIEQTPAFHDITVTFRQ